VWNCAGFAPNGFRRCKTKESWSYQFFSPFTVGQEWLIWRQVFSQIFKVLRWYRWFLMEVLLLSFLLSFNLRQFLICIDCSVWFTGEFHREYQWSARTIENMWGCGWEKTTLLHLTSISHCQGVLFFSRKVTVKSKCRIEKMWVISEISGSTVDLAPSSVM